MKSIAFWSFVGCFLFLMSCKKESVCDIDMNFGTWAGKAECNTTTQSISLKILETSQDTLAYFEYDNLVIPVKKSGCQMDGSVTEGNRVLTISAIRKDSFLALNLVDINPLEKSCFAKLFKQ